MSRAAFESRVCEACALDVRARVAVRLVELDPLPMPCARDVLL